MSDARFAVVVVGPAPNDRALITHELERHVSDVAVTVRDAEAARLESLSARSHLVVSLLTPMAMPERARVFVDVWAEDASACLNVIDRAQRFRANIDAARLPPDVSPVLEPWSAQWPVDARRISARVLTPLGDPASSVHHIGSTAVPGLAAKNIIDVQVSVSDFAVVDDRESSLLVAGFVNVQRIVPDAPAVMFDQPHGEPRSEHLWAKRLYAGTDDDRRVIVHMRRTGSPGWRYALLFRDWLRANDAARQEYDTLKRRLAALHADDANFDDYARAKGSWFAAAYSASERWSQDAGWLPPAESSAPGRIDA